MENLLPIKKISTINIIRLSIFLFAILILLAAINGLRPISTTPTVSNELVSNSVIDFSVSQVKGWLNEHLENPSSIEFIEWSEVKKTNIGNYKVTVKYRAMNSNGETVIESRSFNLNSMGIVIDQVELLD